MRFYPYLLLFIILIMVGCNPPAKSGDGTLTPVINTPTSHEQPAAAATLQRSILQPTSNLTMVESTPAGATGNTPGNHSLDSSIATPVSDKPIPTTIPRKILAPGEWQTLPIIPSVSETARQIYLVGLAMGRDPHAFSKIGDCQNINTFFLSSFENQRLYELGEYANLQETIDWYAGSFGYNSSAVKGGMNVAAVLSPLRSDPNTCNKGESPLACELRLHNASVALISMEEAWSGDVEKYGHYMRQVIEYTINQGVVPVLATKADNLEGEHRINAIIADLAFEYDIPLWNFWAAVQPLPAQGLLEDGFHLTQGSTYTYTVPLEKMSGWSMRNLTALQTLDAIRQQLEEK